MSPWRRRFWARWIAANAIGEFIGLGGIAACAVAVSPVLAGLPSGAAGALLLALGTVALGAFEGAVVGWAQHAVLRARLPALRGWVRATVIGALVAWALGMVPSTVMHVIAAENPAPPLVEPALPVVLLAAAGLGLATGPVLAFFQWRCLRHAVPGGAIWWLPANALAWALGMPMIFLGMQAHALTGQPLLAVAAVAGSLLATGALVGAVHGRVLAARLPPAPQRVLVSACLLGAPVRHDGGHKRSDDAVLQRWAREGRVVAVCPEVEGGLPVPRPAAEIEGGGGHAVLDGRARVLDRDGRDVSAALLAGARHALALVRSQGVRVAVLKEGSPSCGSHEVHDGRFAGQRIAGTGVTAALLEREGVAVFGEDRLAQADAWLRELERRAG